MRCWLPDMSHTNIITIIVTLQSNSLFRQGDCCETLLVWATARLRHKSNKRNSVSPFETTSIVCRQTRPNIGITTTRTITLPLIRMMCPPGRRGPRTWRAPSIRLSSGATWWRRFRAAFWHHSFPPIEYSALPSSDRRFAICLYHCVYTWIRSFWSACGLSKGWWRWVGKMWWWFSDFV